MQRPPHVLINSNRLVCSPAEATAEKCEQKRNAVIELRLRARHIEFVEKPVEVEEWG
jgi:hypothetical protein